MQINNFFIRSKSHQCKDSTSLVKAVLFLALVSVHFIFDTTEDTLLWRCLYNALGLQSYSTKEWVLYAHNLITFCTTGLVMCSCSFFSSNAGKKSYCKSSRIWGLFDKKGPLFSIKLKECFTSCKYYVKWRWMQSEPLVLFWWTQTHCCFDI